MDLYGQALVDFYNQRLQEVLWINTSYGEPEEMPVEVFFRTEEDMPELELIAMAECRGKVLDIGAGAGSHSLLLQNRLDTTALEISKIACTIMQLRGVEKVKNQNIFEYQNEKFDTLLLLMNGIGLCGTIGRVRDFLQHAKKILNKGGSIIFDSSDISYLYQEGVPMPMNYFGEVSFQYQYKSLRDRWFKWVYVDPETLISLARQEGWRTEILYQDDSDQYLARLTSL
ncbi:bifunctional 2-polyprenyl-6-hydroxyphenol methylase/3-demethylubiquinol 3-O-methyltransferase UbiG [Pedobacter sp. SYSU D00535]|uniref:class I SAM-dependent methyltransferase n=1 Tax=Pedobacter sp. SYSU D00535 TaxID=2810308 RepID=UPI001A95D3DD|nr:class I SAM-dependent methyltransferase [Pedobacter sp. SYSU D00535]